MTFFRTEMLFFIWAAPLLLLAICLRHATAT
jgi:hypothetical protein